MTQSFRLADGGLIDRSKPLSFQFNGKTYQGYAGDTLASALIANGIHFVARSFKYHRPRGIMTAGVEEPNAIVQLESGPYTVPNARATEVELYEGLSASSVNARPGLENDRLAFMQYLSRFIPAGFYYKTFMWPRRWWGKYEEHIRDAAGLGTVPDETDPEQYEKKYSHCDVLVVGAGPAGLAAAHSAGRCGARVILVDNQDQFGGSLLRCPAVINGQSSAEWLRTITRELADMPEVQVLTRATAFGYHDHNFVTVCEQLSDHLPLQARTGLRQRLWKIRPRHVILATGAHERPMTFGNNDLPGILLASAVSTYICRFGVLPGRQAVVFTNNDSAYQTALDLQRNGAQVTIVDSRSELHTGLPGRAKQAGIRILWESVVRQADGKRHIESVNIAPSSSHRSDRDVQTLSCDLLAVSGGWNPAVHLYAQSGGRPRWCDERVCFVPDTSGQHQTSVGAANGDFNLQHVLNGAAQAGSKAAENAGLPSEPSQKWETITEPANPLVALWSSAPLKTASRGPKQFIDFQNDVAVSDIQLAVREGYRSVEHVKRYTAMGFGTDQGKLGNINGMAILAESLNQSIAETGTTTYRPNYTPVAFGTIAGPELGDFFDPVRTTCIHEWHVARGAVFEDSGNWKRARYYPQGNEDMDAAVARECLAVRNHVGLLDYSTLGKIDVRGPDAAEFLNRIYTNAWTGLQPGKCRYGFMLDENGMILDDGVNLRLSDQHFIITTTTSGAAKVLSWMERWLQTEWPDLQVYLTSLTDQYATATVAGPDARKVMQKVCHDIDFSGGAFPFMSFQQGTIDGVKVRVLRVSFSGELSYEIYMPSNYGRHIWDLLMQAGAEYQITPYGTEAMHVLRAEKGFIIVGQDTDGSVTPVDLNMSSMVSKSKDFLGKRSLSRSDTAGPNRKQLVGLLSEDNRTVLPEGAPILDRPAKPGIAPLHGHVTSSYLSPALGHPIALAMIRNGLQRMGQSVTIALADGQFAQAKICSPVFYDAEGVRQHVE